MLLESKNQKKPLSSVLGRATPCPAVPLFVRQLTATSKRPLSKQRVLALAWHGPTAPARLVTSSSPLRSLLELLPSRWAAWLLDLASFPSVGNANVSPSPQRFPRGL